MSKPPFSPGSKLCIVETSGTLIVYGNNAAFQWLGESFQWLARSNATEHCEVNLLWDLTAPLTPDYANFANIRDKSMIASELPARFSPGNREMQFMFVPDAELARLFALAKCYPDLLPHNWQDLRSEDLDALC